MLVTCWLHAGYMPVKCPFLAGYMPVTCSQELKFGIGDGHLQYYLYNWRCTAVESNEVGLVLL